MPPDAVEDAYFMTRHHARLLADLSAAAAAAGSVTVIHGDAGLGKTRLLRAFIELRCGDGDWLAIDFLPQGMVRLRHPGGEGTPLPQHELATALDATARVRVWLVDGFELALPQGREVLYAAWQPLRPVPALVLAGRFDWPVAWRAVLPPEPPRLQVARVSPLNPDESRDYLDQRVCGTPGMTLRASGRLRRILRDCGGRIPLLREAAADLDASECQSLQVPASGRGRWLLWLLLALAIAAALWFVRSGVPPSIESPSSAVPAASRTPSPLAAPATEARTTGGEALPVESVPAGQPAPPEPAAPAARSDEPAAPLAEDSRPPEAPDREAVADEQSDRFAAFAAYPLLQARLEATDRWLRDPATEEWSIQLMTLRLGDSAARALERHLQRLRDRGAALERLWVYRAPEGNGRKGHLGLLYGRYASREQAQRASRSLPPALRVKRTLLRSVQSLRRDSGLLPGN